MSSGFIFEDADFEQCHASTIAEVDGFQIAAWFGGTREGDRDVGIWASRRSDDGWSRPVEVANGIVSPDERYPCWNPVLFAARDGTLLLFYKVGPNPRSWWGMLTRSEDGGDSWSSPERLPDGILGPIVNKPVMLPGGDLLCGSSTEDTGWRVHMERSPDLGISWKRTDALNQGREFRAIQPTILQHGERRLQILCRSREGRVTECWSEDLGVSWTRMTATVLPNPNSGIDAVTLRDGRALLVYNHSGRRRTPLNVAVSEDGRAWHAALRLEEEPGEYSYPAVIQGEDGLVHVTYTWRRRRIRHVVLDPESLVLSEMPDGRWPGDR